MFKSSVLNELIEIQTGVTAGNGTNNVSACATAPQAGNLKTCQQVYRYGIIHIGTPILDITQVGGMNTRASLPRQAYNSGVLQSPWLPQIPGIDNLTDVFTNQLRAALFAMATEMKRNVSPVHFAGVQGTEDNTYLGVARQWNGLDNLIKTGYVDASTGYACKAADSTITNYNADISGTDILWSQYD